MIVHDLSVEAVRRMVPVDLTGLDEEPPSPIGTFDFNGCTAGVASFVGRPPWERHDAGDELLLVLAGTTTLTIETPAGTEVRVLFAGDLVVVPRSCWHSNDAPDGVTFLFLTPSTGNQYAEGEPEGR